MSNLQVKNVPDDLYAELRRRAAGAGVTLRDYVLGLIAADQRLPSVEDWADDLHTHEPVALTADEVVAGRVVAQQLDRPQADRPLTEAWVGLLELLAADDASLLERHGRWYIAGRDPRYLRRNALVALGNVAAPGDRQARSVLSAFAAGDDPLLAEHASWALTRLDARAAS